MTFPDSTTLGDARRWLKTKLLEGVPCPLCMQRVQMYKRKVNSGMARSLIAMYTIAGTEWVHVPTQIGARSREEGKLAYFGLVEEYAGPREDGGRAGWWRVTKLGKLFVLKQAAVAKYALVYNGQCFGYEGGPVLITDALGTKFSYEDLMAGR